MCALHTAVSYLVLMLNHIKTNFFIASFISSFNTQPEKNIKLIGSFISSFNAQSQKKTI